MLASIFKTILALCAAAFLLTGCEDGYNPQLEGLAEGREVKLSFHAIPPFNGDPSFMQLAIEGNKTPPGIKLVPYHGNENEQHLLVFERTQIDQDCMTSASAGHSPLTNLPILNFKFDEKCTAIFAKITAENIGDRFAVVIDGVAIAAPIIQAAIDSGAGYIEGFESMEDVEALAYKITAQSLKKND